MYKFVTDPVTLELGRLRLVVVLRQFRRRCPSLTLRRSSTRKSAPSRLKKKLERFDEIGELTFSSRLPVEVAVVLGVAALRAQAAFF